MSEQSGGAAANKNGRQLEEMIDNLLRLKGFSPTRAATLAECLAQRGTLPGYVEAGWFSRRCRVPLTANYHPSGKRHALVDFVVNTTVGGLVVLSAKSQTSGGSAQEKLEYEVQQLIATEYPAALAIIGEGWSMEVLAQLWERSRHFGGGRIYLFRSIEKLSAWISAGLPVAGGTTTYSTVFARWCDREP